MADNYEKDKFLYPQSSYRGEFTPENMVFNSNLQEFAQRVSYICNLETSGKIKPGEAYRNIKLLWKQLKQSKKELGIGEDSQDEV
jgi:hypothetical protein